MALLIDIRDPNWMTEQALRDRIAPDLPDVPILCSLDTGDLDQVKMIAVVKLFPGVAARLPALGLVQKLGAGVDGIVRDQDLRPGIPVSRLKPEAAAVEIAEYCLAYVLESLRNIRIQRENQRQRAWVQIEPRVSGNTTVGVLGLGHIGGRTARLFADTGFRVIGWSRSPKTISGVDCRSGDDALPGLLAECDYVASILPSTPQTRGLFDSRLFAAMRPGATFINAGRGDLVDEDALLAAIDGAHLSGAVLDVFRSEPLPRDHPFWSHDAITVTPHVSGWHADDGLDVIAENYRRLIDGRPLLNLVDRKAGY